MNILSQVNENYNLCSHLLQNQLSCTTQTFRLVNYLPLLRYRISDSLGKIRISILSFVFSYIFFVIRGSLDFSQMKNIPEYDTEEMAFLGMRVLCLHVLKCIPNIRWTEGYITKRWSSPEIIPELVNIHVILIQTEPTFVANAFSPRSLKINVNSV